MKKIIIIVVPAVLLLAVVGFLFLQPKAPPADPAKLAKEPGPTYTIADPFIVNLADTDAPHFVKVAVALQVSKASASKVPAAAEGGEAPKMEEEAEIRDIVISTLQSMTSEELGTKEGREKLKTTIKKRIGKEAEIKLTEVYFTDFAVQ